MSTPGLKLTIYFGERDRLEGRFLADHLLDLFERHELRASALIRGVEGFGAKHGLRTDRLLTLSEDLPLVVAGIDGRDRVEAVAREVVAIGTPGLITLERLALADDRGALPEPDPLPELAVKLTLYIGRSLRAGARPAHQAAVDVLRAHGVDGASVLLGVDGTLRGERQRARFFARNQEVPAMVISVGSAASLAAALPSLRALQADAVITTERVRVLKRDGRLLGRPDAVAPRDRQGLRLWQKLMLYSSEQTHFEGRPVHVEAIRRLRREGAVGATALRGVWGYDGRHPPHGDTFWSVRRRVPTLTVAVDTPQNAQRWFGLLDQITPERGLITSEVVPAFRARDGGGRDGLRLAGSWWAD